MVLRRKKRIELMSKDKRVSQELFERGNLRGSSMRGEERRREDDCCQLRDRPISMCIKYESVAVKIAAKK